MNAFPCPRPDEMGKFFGVVRAFPDIWTGRVLDVGCRSGNFKQVLSSIYSGGIFYCGVDLYPPADVIANLERGLPFGNEAFDVVVALDVLEHTNDIHRAFGELCRVAKKFVVITLPNAYEIRGRVKFLLGRRLSGKYGLPSEPPKDRHRWLFSLKEARHFTHSLAKPYGFEVLKEGCLIGPRRAIGPIRALVSLLPNLLSPTYIVLLGKRVKRGGLM